MGSREERLRRKYGNGRGGSADGYLPATHEEAELLEQLTPDFLAYADVRAFGSFDA
jgi:hypothetical protein